MKINILSGESRGMMPEFLRNMPYIGELFAIGAALSWSIAVIFFKKSGEHVHPIALNLFKNSLSFVLIIITMLIRGVSILPPVPVSDYLILIFAGALGIGIGDTFFFKGLNILGAGRTAIVSCIYSPSMITLSILFLGEKMTIPILIGSALILSAVLITASKKDTEKLHKRDLLIGIVWVITSQLVMVVGVIMSKPILDNNSLLWTSQMRFIGGFGILLIVLLFNKNRREIIGSLHGINRWRQTFLGSFFGAYLALLFWLGGMKYTMVSVSAVLNQLSEIFIFILAGIFLKEAITKRKTVAIVLAFLGAILITLGRNF